METMVHVVVDNYQEQADQAVLAVFASLGDAEIFAAGYTKEHYAKLPDAPPIAIVSKLVA